MHTHLIWRIKKQFILAIIYVAFITTNLTILKWLKVFMQSKFEIHFHHLGQYRLIITSDIR